MIKPTVILIAILVAAGYQFCNDFYKFSYSLKQSSGYHTFIMSVTAGFALFLACFGVHLLLCLINVEIPVAKWILGNAVPDYQFSNMDFLLIECSLGAFVLGWAGPRVYYKIIGKIFPDINREDLMKYEFLKSPTNPEFTDVLFKSYKMGLPVLFTMSDRKVYIGYPETFHSSDFNDISIYPLYSGYRKKDDLSLVTVTPYEHVLEDLSDGNTKKVDLKIFTISLPLREITHAHLHDFKYYDAFKRGEDNHRNDLGRDSVQGLNKLLRAIGANYRIEPNGKDVKE